ncbi:fatty acid synthase, partial [Aspergillus sclerotialis]
MDGLTISEDANKIGFRLSSSSSAKLPDLDHWLSLLAGRSYSWRHALFSADIFVQGHRFQTNPMRRIVAPTAGMYAEISSPDDPSKTTIIVREPYQSGKLVKTVEAKL